MSNVKTTKLTFSQIARGSKGDEKVEEKIEEKIEEKVGEKVEKKSEPVIEETDGQEPKEKDLNLTIGSATIQALVVEIIEKWEEIVKQARNGSAYGYHITRNLTEWYNMIENLKNLFDENEFLKNSYTEKIFPVFNKRISEQTRNRKISDAPLQCLFGMLYDKLNSCERSLEKNNCDDKSFKNSLKELRSINNKFYQEEYVSYVMQITREAAEKHSQQKTSRHDRQLERQKERDSK